MVDGDELSFRQHKNRNRRPVDLVLPFPARLRAVIEQTPHSEDAFLVTEHGKPFGSTAAFGNWLRKRCREACLQDKSAHGLRK